MDAFEIRKALVADIPEIARQRRLLLQLADGASDEALDDMVPRMEGYLATAMPAGYFHAWLAEKDGAVVGGAAVVVHVHPPSTKEPMTRRAHILNVFIYPEHRRRGAGRRLMETAIEWCRAEGFRFADLHATDEGRPLYESLGFRPTNHMRMRLA
jgi:GNAT superfamily N-acetyltransferase